MEIKLRINNWIVLAFVLLMLTMYVDIALGGGILEAFLLSFIEWILVYIGYLIGTNDGGNNERK